MEVLARNFRFNGKWVKLFKKEVKMNLQLATKLIGLVFLILLINCNNNLLVKKIVFDNSVWLFPKEKIRFDDRERIIIDLQDVNIMLFSNNCDFDRHLYSYAEYIKSSYYMLNLGKGQDSLLLPSYFSDYSFEYDSSSLFFKKVYFVKKEFLRKYKISAGLYFENLKTGKKICSIYTDTTNQSRVIEIYRSFSPQSD